MKCAYSAGVLDAFLDDRVSFDYCIGVSAGSGNVASFLAGQRGRNRRFYTEHISDPAYFGLTSFLKTGDMFGLKYIYGTLTNSGGGDSLDYDRMEKNPSEFVIVATNARLGKPAYFTKDEIARDDYRIIMASCAIPSVCRPIVIDGEKYFDGGVSDSLPVRKALKDGCDKLVLIMSKPRDYKKAPEKNRLFYHAMCMRYPNVIRLIDRRHIMYNNSLRYVHDLEKAGKLFLICPSRHLDMDTYGMDEKANEKLYELGIRDYSLLRDDLRKFMQQADPGHFSSI